MKHKNEVSIEDLIGKYEFSIQSNNSISILRTKNDSILWKGEYNDCLDQIQKIYGDAKFYYAVLQNTVYVWRDEVKHETREYYTVFVIMDDTDGVPVGVAWIEQLAKDEAKEREEDDGHSYSVKTVDMDGIATLVDAYFKFRGLTHPDAAQSFLFLTSEMGEVADAIVQDQAQWTRNNPQNKDGSVQKIREELGDVLMMLTKTSQGYNGDPISDMISKFKKKGFTQ